jgi:hypothetical protein
MEIIKFIPQHLDLLMLQPAQKDMQHLFANPEYGQSLAEGTSFTATDGEVVYACGGVVEMWQGRALAWILLSEFSTRHFVKIHRTVKRFFEIAPYHRIEAAVDVGFKEGERWAKMLGFQYEGTMKGYTPDKRDCDLYAIVRG